MRPVCPHTDGREHLAADGRQHHPHARHLRQRVPVCERHRPNGSSTVIPYAVDADNRRIATGPRTVDRALRAKRHVFVLGIPQDHLRHPSSPNRTWTYLSGQLTGREETLQPTTSSDIRCYRRTAASTILLARTGIIALRWTWATANESTNFPGIETLALSYSQHPNDPTRGIAPAMTVKKWANVDDMIADYERGFFGNNAVPAGMLGIVSKTLKTSNATANASKAHSEAQATTTESCTT